MKKNQLKGKLSFDKLTIAKLSNTSDIRGGSLGPGIGQVGSLTAITVESCTLTGFNDNPLSERPTQEDANGNDVTADYFTVFIGLGG